MVQFDYVATGRQLQLEGADLPKQVTDNVEGRGARGRSQGLAGTVLAGSTAR